MLKNGIWDNLTLYSGHGHFYLLQIASMLKYGIWDNLTLYSGHGRFYLFQNKLSLTPFEVRSVFCVLIYFASYVQRLQSAQLPLVPVDLQLGNTSDRSVCQGGCSSWQLRSKRKMKIGYQQPLQRHFPSG